VTLERAWEDYVALAELEEVGHRDSPDRYPHYSENGRWRRLALDETSRWLDDGRYDHGNWTAGFSAGVAWLRRLDDGSPPVSPELRALLAGLPSRAADDTTHDLGFLFFPSFAFAQAIGALAPLDAAPARDAADTLAQRFCASGGFIQAFGALDDPRAAGTSTIDTMMNLPLLWWAAAGRPDLENVAHTHAKTSARVFFRDDGSTYHLSRFDPDTGELLRRGTFQGDSDDSCWSRGQAWAISGFAWAYAATRDPELLNAAERAWSYFVARVPADGVVAWDFSDSSKTAAEDASASAIAALGIAILGHCHPESERRSAYGSAASDLLQRLSRSAVGDGTEDGILLRSSYSLPHGLGVRGATPWGDYFYGLALALSTGRVELRQVVPEPVEQVRQ
jgi:unsaturated chondroitin disaccharide hydrolase